LSRTEQHEASRLGLAVAGLLPRLQRLRREFARARAAYLAHTAL
jgi:hypothetical protein